MNDFDEFKRKQKNHKTADDFKMVTVFILVASALIFFIAGKELVRPIIWYWTAAMVALVIGNVVLDLMANKKDRSGPK